MASTTPTQVLPAPTFSMILKSPTPPAMAPDTNTVYLSAFDQNIVRVYTQTLLIFPFPDGAQAESAIKALVDGLKETLKEFPFLAGTLRLAAHGKLALTYPTTIPDPEKAKLFASKSVSSEQGFDRTYEELKKHGMPPSAFKPDIFCPDDLNPRNYRGMPLHAEGIVKCDKDAVPVLRVQANFIPGGLVLSTYCHHSVMDCSGVNVVWMSYARHISQLSGFLQTTPQSIQQRSDESEQRRALDQRVLTPPKGMRAEAEAYCKGKYKYQQTLPDGKDDHTPCSLKYFVIPAQKMLDYREKLRQRYPDDTVPTICNILAALVWLYVTRARAARVPTCEKQETRIGVATDLRRRSGPKEILSCQEGPRGEAKDEYMGNMALFATGALKIADLVAEPTVTEATVMHTIREIRRTINKVDNDWVLQHLAFFKSIEEIEDTECALGFRFGLDIYVTSWMNFGGDIEWGIPGTDVSEAGLHGRAEFIRRTYGPSDGGMMIMPRRRHPANGEVAPYEVMVRLAEVDMKALLADAEGLKSWAEKIIE